MQARQEQRSDVGLRRQSSQHLRGHTTGEGIRRDVLRHDRASGNHTSRPTRTPGQMIAPAPIHTLPSTTIPAPCAGLRASATAASS